MEKEMSAEERDREADMLTRQALLLQVDAIERKWRIHPRTAELRHEAKAFPVPGF